MRYSLNHDLLVFRHKFVVKLCTTVHYVSGSPQREKGDRLCDRVRPSTKRVYLSVLVNRKKKKNTKTLLLLVGYSVEI